MLFNSVLVSFSALFVFVISSFVKLMLFIFSEISFLISFKSSMISTFVFSKLIILNLLSSISCELASILLDTSFILSFNSLKVLSTSSVKSTISCSSSLLLLSKFCISVKMPVIASSVRLCLSYISIIDSVLVSTSFSTFAILSVISY